MYIKTSRITEQFGGLHKMQQPSWTFSVLFCLIAPVLSDGPQNIAGEDAYKQQRSCARLCYWFVSDDQVALAIDCDSSGKGALDSCWCRPDLQSGAELHLSSCVKSQCSGVGGVGAETVDVSRAVGLYDSYCAEKGYKTDKVPATVTATPTSPQPGLTTVVVYSTPSATSAATGLTTKSSEYGLLLVCAAVSITNLLLANDISLMDFYNVQVMRWGLLFF